MDKLPIRLEKEPLVDAIFGVRFTSEDSAADVLPGFLFGQLKGTKKTERLRAADVPKEIRDADPKLRFAPLIKLYWDKFFIAIGDQSLIIGCKIPYPGWGEFKPAINKVINHIKEIRIIKTIHRHSMKYVDIIPATDLKQQVSLINASISIGDHVLEKENFGLRIEIPREQLLHIVQVASSANLQLQSGEKHQGVVIDIDTIANVQNSTFEQWSAELSEQLDIIHLENKKMFFECLKQSTIEALGPVHE